MKQKIKEALKTRAKNLGLDDSAFDGVAAFGETIVKEDADIEGFVNSEATINLLKTYQSVADKARAAAKAKNEPNPKDPEPGNQTDPNPKPEPPKDDDRVPAWAQAIIDSNKALSDKLAGFEAEQSAKSVLASAEATFKGNDYVKKYSAEAARAWKYANEFYELGGGKMTAEELNSKAMGYFNDFVSDKGIDTTKPFESDGGGKEDELDMTEVMSIYKKSGRVADKKD